MSVIGLRQPPAQRISDLPVCGERAPAFPWRNEGPADAVVAFLRHDGCPFAENTVKQLRSWAEDHPHVVVYLVSHGEPGVTGPWLESIGGTGSLQLIQDPSRALYAAWGLGYTRLWHFAGPASLAGVVRLWFRGIRNRSASGTRWQQAGMFLVEDGVITWRHIPASAENFALPPVAISP